MICYFVPGIPRPKARPRVVNGHAYTPKRTRDWEALVGMMYRGPLHEGTVSMTLDFQMPNRRRVDLDNLIKACADALNGRAYHDDGQIVSLTARKTVDPDRPGVWISLAEAGQGQ